MSQRFQCGLVGTHAYVDGTYKNPVGRFFHRWLVEWLTQVVGWSLVDTGTAVWSAVAASGSTCSSTTATQIEVTSPGYAFSAASEGGYLTLTGFAAPFQARDGIYRIRRYIGSVGSVYTLELETDFGVHSDGIPIGHSGINWRLFFANSTYCPSVNTDYAVVGGTGKTGAGLTDAHRHVGTSEGTLAASGGVVTLTDTQANFQDSDVGKSITIAAATTSGHNGTFTIASRVSATEITWSNGAGGLPASEDFEGQWTIRYTFHVHFRPCSVAGNFGFGEIRISPWASWDAVNHQWTVGDNRYTAAWDGGEGFQTWDGGSTTSVFFYGEADLDHFTVVAKAGRGAYYESVASYHASELDTFYPDQDPRPCCIWVGSTYQNLYIAGWEYGEAVIGPPSGGISSIGGQTYWGNGFRALGWDNVTTLTYYAMIAIQMPSVDPGWSLTQSAHRKLSTRSRMIYKLPVVMESRSSGFMEIRGVLRQVWHCPPTIPMGYQQGASGEYVSVLRGILMPWNNSRNANPEMGYIPVGCG